MERPVENTKLATDRVARRIAALAVGGDRGFTLIELLSVVGLIVLLSAIAVSSLLRARMAGMEASAVTSVRTIGSAQSAFAASCGGGYYAPGLSLLGTPSIGSTDSAFIGADLNSDPSVKSTYTMAITAGPPVASAPASCNGAAEGTVVETYFTSAVPAGAGFRFFGANQGGLIYEGMVPVPVTRSGAPAGATAIQ